MSHYLIFPTNENGLILDPGVRDELVSLAHPPFDFNDFFVYSHGWWTDATRAISDYNRFSVDFTRAVRAAQAAATAPVLGTGIHWPSMLSEDGGNITNYLEALSFYTMEKRADSIGEHAGFTLLRTLFDELKDRPNPFRIHLIGHSFGCKVVCSTLEEIVSDDGGVPPNAQVNVVLLQAAFDNNSLDPAQCYGDVVGAFPNIRFLISRSTEDIALQKAYPDAHKLANLFKSVTSALGAAGPTAAFQAAFGGSVAQVSVDSGFTKTPALGANRLVIADLSPLHQHDHDRYKADPFTGHHSDIFQPEIYQLLLGFLFQ
jgi:hypothetical protein